MKLGGRSLKKIQIKTQLEGKINPKHPEVSYYNLKLSKVLDLAYEWFWAFSFFD